MKVQYYGLIRSIVGRKEDEVQLSRDGTTVGELIEVLASNYGERLRKHLVTRRGSVNPNVKIFVGDRDIAQDDGLHTRLDSKAPVTFVVTVSQLGGG